MVRTLMMKHALLNLENQIVEVNGGGQNSEFKMTTPDSILLELLPQEKKHTPAKSITGK